MARHTTIVVDAIKHNISKIRQRGTINEKAEIE